MASANVISAGRKHLCLHLRKRGVWETDVMEAAHYFHCTEVLRKVEFVCRVGTVKNEVELELVWLLPVFVF